MARSTRVLLLLCGWWLVSGVAGFGSPLPGAAAAPMVLAADRVEAPPSLRVIAAAVGGWRLRLTVAAEGAEPEVAAVLQDANGRTRWRRFLPQTYGPRHALVAADGRVLFLDEWVPIASRYAVMALDADGEPVAILSAAALAALLGVAPRTLMEGAREGVWLAGDPVAEAEAILAPTGVGPVRIGFDGSITRP